MQINCYRSRARRAQNNAVELLGTLLPADALSRRWPASLGIMELDMCWAFFTFDLKSGRRERKGRRKKRWGPHLGIMEEVSRPASAAESDPATTAGAMAPPPLPEELVEEVLLRLPPDDPACLARAALVSKSWRRLICGRWFRRRF